MFFTNILDFLDLNNKKIQINNNLNLKKYNNVQFIKAKFLFFQLRKNPIERCIFDYKIELINNSYYFDLKIMW